MLLHTVNDLLDFCWYDTVETLYIELVHIGVVCSNWHWCCSCAGLTLFLFSYFTFL